jgi:hypothetical protein
MDHADSTLFHTLEDTVRLHNAQVLGFLRESGNTTDLAAAADELMQGDDAGKSPLGPTAVHGL